VSCTSQEAGRGYHLLTLTFGILSIKLIILLLYVIMCWVDVYENKSVFTKYCLWFFFLKELVEYYKHHSLKEGFRTLDTTLQFPYKEPEHSAGQRGNRTGNSCEYCHWDYYLLPLKCCRQNSYIKMPSFETLKYNQLIC
jgi:hypothetical protein